MLFFGSKRKQFALVTTHDLQRFQPSTPTECDEVRAQLDRLLRSSHFRNSRRYPTLLRYVVEAALDGRQGDLKERVLGMEVFGRAPDYDTASDPIVRVTIAEIRKRIAQYYHEEAHSSELRIELTPGSYIPEFLIDHPTQEQAQEDTVGSQLSAPSATEILENESPAPRSTRFKPLWWIATLVLALTVVAAVVFAWRLQNPTPVESLWTPFFAEKGPVTFCLPMSVRRNGPGKATTLDDAMKHVFDLKDERLPASGTFIDHELLGENVVYSDVLAMMKLEPIVEAEHRPVRVRLNFGTDLNDLREGPAIFIGGLDNQWSLQILAPLRYHFSGSDADSYFIQDANAPSRKDWSLHVHDKMATVNRDYAIIARVHSKSFGQLVIVAAGIGMSGTAAAGEFLASPDSVRELERRIGPALRDHDFEAVLQTDVINGIAGQAQLVAVDVH